jgi:DNA replication protein DnaC
MTTDIVFAKDLGTANLQKRALERGKKSTDVNTELNELAPNIMEQQILEIMFPQGSKLRFASQYSIKFKKTTITNFLFNDFHKSNKKFIILTGGTGCGKTHGAVAYIASITIPKVQNKVQSHNSCFIKAYELSQLIINKDFSALNKLKNVSNLIIDDLGTEPDGYKGSGFNKEFNHIIDVRHEKQLKTIITTNLRSEKINENYGDRLCSRVNESGGVFETTDNDMRII